jgi:hypothetical protein
MAQWSTKAATKHLLQTTAFPPSTMSLAERNQLT